MDEHTRKREPRSRAPYSFLALPLVLSSLILAACPPDELSCSTERCEVWICGEARPACPCSDLCERPGCTETTVWSRDPETGACLELSSPCEVPEGWEYFTELEACDGGQDMCRSHEDCGADEICDVRSCVSDDVGTCVERPEICTESFEPVIGCDGLPYDNDCLRLQAGARLNTEGPTVGCDDSTPVWAADPDTGVCTYYAGTCFVPDDWALFFSREECEGLGCAEEPVWVFDMEEGRCVEVASACIVPMGMEFFPDHEQCEGAAMRCGSDTLCEAGMVCDPLSCGEDLGVCIPLPADCAEIESYTSLGEVCGCDGVTYSGDCERLLAGVGLAFRGSCDESGSVPGGW